jgi:hypothetical protein
MTPERYLELQFIKGIRKGYLTNAELSPQGTALLLPYMSSEEHCIVVVQDKQKRRLWFTNRRLLLQEQSKVTALFEYEAVERVHWMFKDFWVRLRPLSALPDEEFVRTKTDHFDRLEVELKTGNAGLVTLEGLDQSYLPIFQFLQFLTQTRSSS